MITALGIRGVGEVVAATLAGRFGSLDNLQGASFADLENIPGIGPNIAQAILDWFEREGNQLVLLGLKNAGVWPVAAVADPAEEDQLPLAGESFVITGKLQAYTRNELKEKLMGLGARVSGSVSSKTGYVVVGEDPGSKYQKALDLGIPILSEEELDGMLSEIGQDSEGG